MIFSKFNLSFLSIRAIGIDKKLKLNLENIIDFGKYIKESYAIKSEGYLLSNCVYNYWIRAKHEGLPLKGLFYYCHIHNN
jgi:hypothetical protein